MSLAQVQEQQGDWDGAFKTWDALRKLATQNSIREVAELSLKRVNDERVIARLTQAEKLAAANEFSEAINLLLDAAGLNPSERIFDRVSNRYYEFITSWFGTEILKYFEDNEWESVAVVAFAGGSDLEGCSLRDRICSALVGPDMPRAKILSVSEGGIKRLREGRFNSLPNSDKAAIENSNADAVVFGTIGEELRGYLLDTRNGYTRPIVTVKVLGSIPGFPHHREAWARLPRKASTSRSLRIEVWTDKVQYAIGSEVIFHLRSNKDCYVTLVDLQTSGGLYVLFPNAYQRDNFLIADTIYSIPSVRAPFTINAGGPLGVEGVKAIACTKPLTFGKKAADQVFVVARTPALQKELCERIAATVREISDEDWDVGEWTFEIVK